MTIIKKVPDFYYFRNMKRTFHLSILSLLISFALNAQSAGRTDYIERFKETAIAEMKYSGIPASITLAQACLESGDGKSTLAREGNNHFGIKCHGWKGGAIYHDDDKKGECFRKYKSPEESFRDHSDFLRYSDRYAFLFDLEPTDYKGWAYGLKSAGYATNPEYAKRLIQIIEENELYKYDTDIPQTMIPPSPASIERPVAVSWSIQLSRNIMSRNKVKYIVANGGETIKSLANELGLFQWEILKFNDLKKNAVINAGDIIFIEAKKKEAAEHIEMHVVEEGETVWSISQRFAVREEYIRKYNGLKKNQEPSEGTLLKLRKK